MQIYGPSQLHGAQPLHGPHATRSLEPATSAGPSAVGDRLDISEAGQIAARLAEIPEVRAERVQELRTAILNGTFETDERLSGAVERLLDEIA